jgi:hypothetical protein
VQGSAFDELDFFRGLERSAARALLIGRRALAVLGLPVLTADYDFWIHADDAAAFNTAAEPFGLLPTHTPEEARRRGRYVLQNDERVDVLVARSLTTVDQLRVDFEVLWPRRRRVELAPGVGLWLPALDDLIQTKRFAARPRDAEDIRMLEILKGEEDG